MRVVIQAADLDHQRIDGTRVYLREVLRRFGTLAPETKFDLYHAGVFNSELAPPHLPNYTEHRIPFQIAWMQTRFAWELFRKQPEKLFLPIQAAPMFLPRGIEVTATIHDLAFKKFPEMFPFMDRLKLNLLLAVVVHRADKLIAVSEATKKDLLHYFPELPEGRVRVIHHGFDGRFFGERLASEILQEKLRRWDLSPGGYVLYVGALQPRKNLVRLIQAFEQAKKECPEMKLVLAGEAAWLADSIQAAQEQSPYRDDIIMTGRVSFEELRALYQGARMFIFPSLYEGFGLPLLEAFASNVPVLTAHNSSLVEVAGEAALYCQAEDVDDITTQLKRLWTDEKLRTELIVKGTERLTSFSWEKCAKETLQYLLDK